MCKKILILPLLFFSLTFAQDFTIKSAVDTAFAKNHLIKQYEERIIQKEKENKKAWGNFLPSIEFNWTYTHLNDPLVIDLAPIREGIIQLQAKTQTEITNIYNIIQKGAPLSDAAKLGTYNAIVGQLNTLLPPFVETLKNQDYRTANFTAVQPLFLGGKLLAAKNYAASDLAAAEYELEKIKNETSKEVISIYLKVKLLEKVLNTRENVLKGILKHKDRAEKLVEQGLIASVNLLRAKVAVSEAERKLKTDKNNYELALIAFKKITGIDDSAKVNLTDSLVYNEPDINLTDLTRQAKENQPVLKILNEKEYAAKQKYNVERSKFLPQVAAFGKYEIYPQYLSALEPRWAVGISLKMNLFNGFKDYLDLQTASHLENEVHHIKLDAENKISLLVNKSYSEYKNQQDSYISLQNDLDLATENLRVNEKRFESGYGTSLEVIDASLSLEKVEIDRLVALYGYYEALTNIYMSCGNPGQVIKILNKEN